MQNKNNDTGVIYKKSRVYDTSVVHTYSSSERQNEGTGTSDILG